MVKSGTKLDYETKQTYSVTLKAADSFGDYDTIDGDHHGDPGERGRRR